MKTANEIGDESLKEAFEVADKEFLLADTLDEFEDTEDESDDNDNKSGNEHEHKTQNKINGNS